MHVVALGSDVFYNIPSTEKKAIIHKISYYLSRIDVNHDVLDFAEA